MHPSPCTHFCKSFFSFASPIGCRASTRANDPGARFGAFDFSYRLPFMRKWLTLYTDSEVHDEVSPIDAPRRAALAARPLSLARPRRAETRSARRSRQWTDPSGLETSAERALHVLGRRSRGRATPTRASSSATGSAAKTRADRPGSPITSAAMSGSRSSVRNQKATKDFIPGSASQIDPTTAGLIRRHHAQRHQFPGRQAHRQRLRDQRQLRPTNTGRRRSTSRVSKP